jgi:hypothetical protein
LAIPEEPARGICFPSLHRGKGTAADPSVRMADREHFDDRQPDGTRAFPYGHHPIALGPQGTRRKTVRTSSLLIALAVLGHFAPANALTGHPATSHQVGVAMNLVAQRRSARPLYRGARPYRHYRGHRPYRMPPPAIAPPMERVPQVAPLAPRIGN